MPDFHGPSPWSSHTFRSLLNSSYSDIQVACFGHIYHLHKVILDRAEYFHNMLSGPWREGHGQHTTIQTIPITFPPQVNRAAFELCLSRIHEGGPRLVPPPWADVSGPPLLLGRTHALLACAAGVAHGDQLQADAVHETAAWALLLTQRDHQPAPPNLSLSVLVCADYLGMESLVYETLRLIRSTITPFTIIPYLQFAQGTPFNNELSDSELLLGCRNLESIARPNLELNPTDADLRVTKHDGKLCYGPFAEAIGFACASWLGKWSTELIRLEEVLSEQDEQLLLPAGQAEAALVRLIGDVPGEGQGGEWERYRLAKRVTELREQKRAFLQLKQKSDDIPNSDIKHSTSLPGLKPDPELFRMFQDGIYYSHLTFDQLYFISTDRSPIWKKNYVSHSRLTEATWLANEMRIKQEYRLKSTQPLEKASVSDLPLYVVAKQQTFEVTPFEAPPKKLTDANFFGLGRNIFFEIPSSQKDRTSTKVTSFEPYRFSSEFVGSPCESILGQKPLSCFTYHNSTRPVTRSYAGLRFNCQLYQNHILRSANLSLILVNKPETNTEAPPSAISSTGSSTIMCSKTKLVHFYFSLQASANDGISGLVGEGSDTTFNSRSQMALNDEADDLRGRILYSMTSGLEIGQVLPKPDVEKCTRFVSHLLLSGK
ncbi:hypothetical protein CROQUDRAFT_87037 [Cronartium quercuum f. sp. fusiforme G11]|uniref:BTB domain-containing protein n=1 Tax=Cronartium quercuum f. sp. fusiforme G11 TaxID=708437 RepID=A0A9P6NXG2_9BASI|nr:hypothetical protein CROQUDRAFT_87037 [Cronartium quercuum f. sp. fusiforme G11]